MTDTEELERLAASITPGPWRKHGNGSQVVSEGALIASLPYAAVSKPNSRAITIVPDLLAEVIALRAEVDRLQGLRKFNSDMAMLYLKKCNEAEARATAAEADADRLAEALDRMIDWTEGPMDRFGPMIRQAQSALDAHTQRVNASKGSDQ